MVAPAFLALALNSIRWVRPAEGIDSGPFHLLWFGQHGVLRQIRRLHARVLEGRARGGAREAGLGPYRAARHECQTAPVEVRGGARMQIVEPQVWQKSCSRPKHELETVDEQRGAVAQWRSNWEARIPTEAP
jgi:hypothetical protein